MTNPTSARELPELPAPHWARDCHGETEVYTADDMRAYAALARQQSRVVDAAMVERACRSYHADAYVPGVKGSLARHRMEIALRAALEGERE